MDIILKTRFRMAINLSGDIIFLSFRLVRNRLFAFPKYRFPTRFACGNDRMRQSRNKLRGIKPAKEINIEKISPRPSFPKRGFNPSLWQREVMRDFVTEHSFNFVALNSLYGPERPAPGRFSE
jgi:hypothetical protein